MKISIAAFAMVTSLTIVGCVSPTAYGPASSGAAYGYSESERDDGIWIVRARTNGAGGLGHGRDMAVYRAAELMSGQGFSHMQIVYQNGVGTIGASAYQSGERMALYVKGTNSPAAPSSDDCVDPSPDQCFTLNVAETLDRLRPRFARDQ